MDKLTNFIDVAAADYVGSCAARINPDWMLITGGSIEKGAATMTISWGAFGFLWGRHLALAAVRRSRHTLPFILENRTFSLSFFDQSFREKLYWCGRNSGHSGVDKIAHCGFTTVYDNDVPFFDEAQSVVICRLMYTDDISPAGFSDKALFDEWYGHGVHKDDMHTMLYASIERVLVKKGSSV